jgi:hypothetical protein
MPACGEGVRRAPLGSGVAALALALAILPAWGCASRPAPPGPGEARGFVPDLRGQRVLVLPVQLHAGIPDGTPADAELAHALRTHGHDVGWVFPPEVDELLARSPGVSALIRELPVGVFLRAEVERIGDPLYGDLRRLSALTGAGMALIPVELRRMEAGSYRITAALVSLRSGRVNWQGVVEGDVRVEADPAALASAAERLARAVLPLGWGGTLEPALAAGPMTPEIRSR